MESNRRLVANRLDEPKRIGAERLGHFEKLHDIESALAALVDDARARGPPSGRFNPGGEPTSCGLVRFRRAWDRDPSAAWTTGSDRPASGVTSHALASP